ncbi:IS630 family transposase [Bradyrhizobium sp. TZ2]
MRELSDDRTVERNYIRRWQSLISEYEAVREGRSDQFRRIGDFYRHHGTCAQTFRKYYNRYRLSGVETDLLPQRRGPKKRAPQAVDVSEALFKTLHAPPSDFGYNRTTWKAADLQDALKTSGVSLTKRAIRATIKSAGYRWLKARKVLTSNDPNYQTKLDKVHGILSSLKVDEGFFSIDEFGPFAIKQTDGRRLVAPGETATVPQWQSSKGFLIVTAALELATNQVTHFYSEKKNTDEIVKLIEMLLGRYRHLPCIYLSWDAASWHISKRLTEKIEAMNVMAYVTGSPRIELAPLPARAQFLNVIESIFSGMARAIIHNSSYASKEEAKAAIDRYFDQRNEHFRLNPKRAGNRIWGVSGTQPSFPIPTTAKVQAIDEERGPGSPARTFGNDRTKSGASQTRFANGHFGSNPAYRVIG